jgi:hypothetical protein
MSSQMAVLDWLGKKASEELKNLLENKHVYQKVDINPSAFIETVQLEPLPGIVKEKFKIWAANDLPKHRFSLSEQQLYVAARGVAVPAPPALTLILPHISLFCRTCGRREAFVPVWYTDVGNEIRVNMLAGASKKLGLPDGLQMFLLLYQCQRCLGTPEGFLVRRDVWNISLHGRSPIERTEVPKYIPQIESKFYRDSLIAFNTG